VIVAVTGHFVGVERIKDFANVYFHCTVSSSGAASTDIWGAKSFYSKRATVFCLGHRLS